MNNVRVVTSFSHIEQHKDKDRRIVKQVPVYRLHTKYLSKKERLVELQGKEEKLSAFKKRFPGLVVAK